MPPPSGPSDSITPDALVWNESIHATCQIPRGETEPISATPVCRVPSRVVSYSWRSQLPSSTGAIVPVTGSSNAGGSGGPCHQSRPMPLHAPTSNGARVATGSSAMT